MATWKQLIVDQLEERNKRETKPYEYIYAEHQRFWQQYSILDKNRDVAKHKLHILEFAVQDKMIKSEKLPGSVNTKTIADLVYKSVNKISEDLMPTEATEGADREYAKKILENSLSKQIFDQGQKIFRLKDELQLAKESLRNTHEQMVSLSEEISAKTKEIETLKNTQKSQQETSNK